jgi:GTP cyclohydrolase II
MHVPQRVIRPHSEWLASTDLPTRHGHFKTHVFRTIAGASDGHEDGYDEGRKEHVVLVHGDVVGKAGVPVRVHSECMTSEVFGSLKCDCKEQLDTSLAEIVHRGAGAVIYLRQEGRGIGLANKIRAYNLQSSGHDTVDANRLLGLPDDARRYDVVPEMLDHLGIVSIRLMTNNPDKVQKLRSLGVDVVGRLPVIIEPNAYSAGYLEAKRVRMAHDLPALRAVPAVAISGPLAVARTCHAASLGTGTDAE